MRLLLSLLRASWTTVVLAAVAGAASGLSTIVMLGLIQRAIRGTGSPGLIVGFVALCLVTLLGRLVSQALLLDLMRRSVTRLSMLLSRQILAAPLRRLEEIGFPRILAVLTGDVPSISQALNTLPMLFINLTLIVGALTYLGWLSLPLLGVVLGFLVLVLVIQRVLMAQAIRHIRLAREGQDKLTGHFRSLMEGVKELKMHRPRCDAFVNRVLQATIDGLEQHSKVGQLVFATASSLGRLLLLILIGLLLFVAPVFHATDSETLTGFTLVLIFLMVPLQGMGGVIPILSRAGIALQKIQAMGLLLSGGEDRHPHFKGSTASEMPVGPPQPRDEENLPLVNPQPPLHWQSVEVVGATYTYRTDEGEGFVLGPIDLTLRPGELVFLSGGNGSGKTTLSKLLLGLYTPDAGEIRLDGQPVTEASRERYRHHFSVVFNDFYLFESLLGLDLPALDDKARQFLVRLRLDRVVQVKDGVLSTTNLSQGQRKRLALLTAYLEDRPIYVFDEWAADQDPQFKEVFYTQMLPELKARGKGVFVISHDDRYYHVADRVLRLEDGKLVQD